MWKQILIIETCKYQYKFGDKEANPHKKAGGSNTQPKLKRPVRLRGQKNISDYGMWFIKKYCQKFQV